MKDDTWSLLLPELKKVGKDDLSRENWDTWWCWNNLRQRTILPKSKGVKVLVKKPMRQFYWGKPLTEIVKGKEKPKIRHSTFNKSFFHISQTKLRGTE